MSLFATTERDAAVDELHSATAIYTAQAVVDVLLGHLDWPRGDRRLLDPSCGDGMFLERAVSRLVADEPAIAPHRLAALVHGWEIHPFAADQARTRLARLLRASGWHAATAAATAKHIVRNADFLTEGPGTARYDAIAGNPPYLRWLNVPAILRTEYERVAPDYARADLMHSFIDRCCQVLSPDGEIGLVTADRWLFNEGSARLRQAIGAEVALRHVERLDAASAFYRPKQRVRNSPPRIHPVAIVLCRPGPDTRAITAAPIYPDAAPDESPAHRTLGDIAVVRLGPLVDKVGCWLLDAQAAAKFPPELLIPAVDTDDIRDGVLMAPTRFVLRDIDDPPSAVKDHVLSKYASLPPRMQRPANPWLPPERWKEFDLSKPSLLVPRIARSLRPIHIPVGILPVNHSLSLVSSSACDLDQLEAALTADRAAEWIQARAARLENKYLSITTRLLRALPIWDESQ